MNIGRRILTALFIATLLTFATPEALANKTGRRAATAHKAKPHKKAKKPKRDGKKTKTVRRGKKRPKIAKRAKPQAKTISSAIRESQWKIGSLPQKPPTRPAPIQLPKIRITEIGPILLQPQTPTIPPLVATQQPDEHELIVEEKCVGNACGDKENEAEGAVDIDCEGKGCKNISRFGKQKLARDRIEDSPVRIPYMRNYSQIKSTPGIVKFEAGDNFDFTTAVTHEKMSKSFLTQAKKCRGKGKRRQCGAVTIRVTRSWWVKKQRNYTTETGAKFFSKLGKKLKPLNNNKDLVITSACRDHAKQEALRQAGWPTASIDTDGRFLSSHCYCNAIDLSKNITIAALRFLTSRLKDPFLDINPRFRPVIFYYEASGSIHIDAPTTKEQLALMDRLLEATDNELPMVVASVRTELTNLANANISKRKD